MSVRELGKGSFATVEEYALRGQRVAVKRLRPELFANQDEIKCFVTEGMTLAKLSHRRGAHSAGKQAIGLISP